MSNYTFKKWPTSLVARHLCILNCIYTYVFVFVTQKGIVNIVL